MYKLIYLYLSRTCNWLYGCNQSVRYEDISQETCVLCFGYQSIETMDSRHWDSLSNLKLWEDRGVTWSLCPSPQGDHIFSFSLSFALWTGLLRMCHSAWLVRAQTWILTPVAWLGQTTVVAMSQDLLLPLKHMLALLLSTPPTPYLNRKGLRLPSPSRDLEWGRGSLSHVSCGAALLWFVVGPQGA